MTRDESTKNEKVPWNRGKLIGQKLPLTQQQIWTIRMRLEPAGKCRDLALFNLAIDSKLRACDLLRLKVSDISNGEQVASRATVVQQKTGRPVRFELTPRTRESLEGWIVKRTVENLRFLLGGIASRIHRLSGSSRRYDASGDEHGRCAGDVSVEVMTGALRRSVT